MSWVPRNPKPADFCGCPPCPICFCWAGDDGLMDGMMKFTQDMLGGKKPSASEEQTLKDAAQAIHVANLGASDRIDAELKEADRLQYGQRQMDAALAQMRAKTERPEAPKRDMRPTLDDLDPSVFEEKPKPNEYVTWGSSQFVTIFDEIIKRDMDRFLTQGKFFSALDLAAPAKKDAKEIQADFAREKAKERMREMARAKR